MKTIQFLRLTGIVLVGLILTAQVDAVAGNVLLKEKNALILTVDKPVVEFMAKAYTDKITAKDIFRLQKVAGQIDQVVVTFRDQGASDYVLNFKPLDEQGLEAWMFDKGYLESAPETVSVPDVWSEPAATAAKQWFKAKRKPINLSVDTPIIEYLSRIYADQIEADDILRLQKLCKEIDHVTVTFRDEDAADYVLNFKCLNDEELEDWMFIEGYLVSQPEPEPEPVALEPWMLDINYLE
jgi:hypothetical protein